jgi:translation elongation factor EF-Tu-like GTPase
MKTVTQRNGNELVTLTREHAILWRFVETVAITTVVGKRDAERLPELAEEVLARLLMARMLPKEGA